LQQDLVQPGPQHFFESALAQQGFLQPGAQALAAGLQHLPPVPQHVASFAWQPISATLNRPITIQPAIFFHSFM
jgi:hypothetical protein